MQLEALAGVTSITLTAISVGGIALVLAVASFLLPMNVYRTMKYCRAAVEELKAIRAALDANAKSAEAARARARADADRAHADANRAHADAENQTEYVRYVADLLAAAHPELTTASSTPAQLT